LAAAHGGSPLNRAYVAPLPVSSKQVVSAGISIAAFGWGCRERQGFFSSSIRHDYPRLDTTAAILQTDPICLAI
jgi:hypothetical protein